MSDQTWIGIAGPVDINFFNLIRLSDLMLQEQQKFDEAQSLQSNSSKIWMLLVKFSVTETILNGLEYCREWFTGKTGLYMKMKRSGYYLKHDEEGILHINTYRNEYQLFHWPKRVRSRHALEDLIKGKPCPNLS